MKLDVAMCDELLGTTRAVRIRLDLTRPVPRDVLRECVELAVQAFTGSNTQGWRWVIVDDQETRSDFAKLYRFAAEPYLTASVGNTPEGQTKRVFASALYLMEHLHEVPVPTIPCIQGQSPSGNMGSGFYGSICPAVWSFQLALRARGLGSCLTTLHLAKVEEAAALLGLPDNITQVALLPVAWTLGTDFRRASRPSVEGITHWNSWGE